MEAQSTERPIGTGFLVSTERNHVLLVTARHAVEEWISTNPAALVYRVNRKTGGSILVKETDLLKEQMGPWFLSNTADVACRFLAWPGDATIAAIPRSKFLKREGLQAGAPLLLLGFPLGLRSIEQSLPIARKGIVARSDSDGLIADAFVFPGNSGGPVVYVPTFKTGQGLTSPLVAEEMLVGMVQAFIPYQEPAIGLHTKRVRVIFEENSGLAQLIPVNAIIELLDRSDAKSRDAALPPMRPAK